MDEDFQSWIEVASEFIAGRREARLIMEIEERVNVIKTLRL